MDVILLYLMFVVISSGWALLWVKTFGSAEVKRFIAHNAIFFILSVLISYIALRLIYAPADETYSANNLGALGLLYLVFLQFFVPACISAIFVTLVKLLNKRSCGHDNKFRLYCVTAAVTLFVVELFIGTCADGWVRSYLGDVLIMPLMYTLWRSVSPQRPRPGLILPTFLLAFSFTVEFTQFLGAASMIDGNTTLGLLLRTVIGTSFSIIDLLCYVIGTVPLYIVEFIRDKHHLLTKRDTGE